MSFDPKCYELAKYFTQNETECREETAHELAQLIQDVIEDFLSDKATVCRNCGREIETTLAWIDRVIWIHKYNRHTWCNMDDDSETKAEPVESGE